MIIKLKDGSEFEGSIERETAQEIWLDETRALGDIVVLPKNEIDSMTESESSCLTRLK